MLIQLSRFPLQFPLIQPENVGKAEILSPRTQTNPVRLRILLVVDQKLIRLFSPEE